MSHRVRPARCEAYTLLEALIVVAILGVVTAIALPSMQEYLRRKDIAQAIADIRTIEVAIERHVTATGPDTYPPDLAAVGLGGMRDPWGNPYQYLNIINATRNITGQVRKDRNLHPLNTDYDLYSKGPDGRSATPLTAATSKDDIIRANDGGFVGLGADY